MVDHGLLIPILNDASHAGISLRRVLRSTQWTGAG